MTDKPGSDEVTWAVGVLEQARRSIHKASEGSPQGWPGQCIVCGQHVKAVPGGSGIVWVHSDSGAVAAPNPPCYQPEKGWKLMQDEDTTLASGTELEVKAAARGLVRDAHSRQHEAELRSELYLERPDGTHQGQKYDGAGFVPGEAIVWVDVDW